MTPTLETQRAIVAAAGADTTTLGGALWLFAIKEPFTSSPALVADDAWIADFATSTPISVTAATRPALIDSITGEYKLHIPPPAGGFHWTTTAGTNLPQTIYGVMLSSSSVTIEGADLLGSMTLPEPITLTVSGQDIDIDPVDFNFLASSPY